MRIKIIILISVLSIVFVSLCIYFFILNSHFFAENPHVIVNKLKIIVDNVNVMEAAGSNPEGYESSFGVGKEEINEIIENNTHLEFVQITCYITNESFTESYHQAKFEYADSNQLSSIVLGKIADEGMMPFDIEARTFNQRVVLCALINPKEFNHEEVKEIFKSVKMVIKDSHKNVISDSFTTETK